MKLICHQCGCEVDELTDGICNDCYYEKPINDKESIKK